MRIVQVAAEFSPIAKAGGLGEVLVGLSRELTRIGEQVEVILPKYDLIPAKALHRLHMELPEFFVSEYGRPIANAMWSAEVENCSLKLLDSRHPKRYFGRDKIYGFEDDPARFLYFSRAVVEYLKLRKTPIDILHLHDWHVSAIAPLVREVHSLKIAVRSIVLTIHNVEYQGKCRTQDLEAIGLTQEIFRKRSAPGDPAQPFYNLLQIGIEYADAIIPVSPSYAQEILTPEHGFGLDPILRRNAGKIEGILNGIDIHLWNPETDPALPMHYAARDAPEKIAHAKQAARAHLADRFHLDAARRPWIGSITRLVPQKGPELLEEALYRTLDLKGTFVLIGSSPIPEIQRHFEKLKERYKKQSQILLFLGYDEQLARQAYAALDFFLIPSRSEPCGLAQMIAMHYGTVPIARCTGGLKDTVFDVETPSKRNGFLFKEPSPDALNQALRRAFQLWHTDPSTLQAIAHRGMQTDFGWARPAQEYLKKFKQLTLY